MVREHGNPWQTAITVLLAAVTFIASCAKRAAIPAPSASDALRIAPVICLLPGPTLLIPVRVTDAAPRPARVTVLFGELRLPGDLRWLGPSLAESAVIPPAPDQVMAAAWAGLTPVEAFAPWRESLPSQRPVTATGEWVVIVRIDPKRLPQVEQSSVVTVAGQNARVRWLRPSPEPTSAEQARHDSEPRKRSSAVRTASLLLAVGSPLQRWRARLLVGNVLVPAVPYESMPLDNIPELLARQIEAGWRTALHDLEAGDAPLARDVAARLVATVDFSGALGIPAWPATASGLADTLLAAGSPAAVPVDRARLWLSMQPEALAWVIDDAGARDLLSDGAISTVGIANLSAQPVACSSAAARSGAATGLGAEGGAAPGTALELLALPAFSAGSMTAPSSAPDLSGAGPHLAARLAREGVGCRITLGLNSIRRRLYPIPQPVLPPGARIGPLLPDRSMHDWLAQAADDPEAMSVSSARALLDPAWLTVGLVHRGSAGAASAPSPTRPEPWQVYLEFAQLRDPLTTPSRAADTGYVRLWLGPFGAPSAVLRVLADGTVRDESGSAFTLPPRSAVIAVEGRRWSAWVPLPSGAIESDGTLRIGVERLDARGVRTAWPRPMLPWQTEPGRAALDTSTWAAASE